MMRIASDSKDFKNENESIYQDNAEDIAKWVKNIQFTKLQESQG